MVSDWSALLASWEHQLRRSLDTEETRLLHALSAAGVAKVNTDLSRGVDATVTLGQLRVSLLLLGQRRATLEAQLSAKAKAVAEKMPRPLTTDEMALLVEGSLDEVLEELRKRSSPETEPMEIVLEELAAEHKFESLRRDARLCSAVMH
eukprot:RCo030241